MAIIENVLLKGCRGSLGEFVIYQCRGKTCIRFKGNYDHVVYSPRQKAQQERITSVAMLYRSVKAMGLQKCWQYVAEGTTLTGYNLFVQRNSPVFTGEGVVSDFEKLQLTIGSLQLPDGIELCKGGDGEWIITWRNQEYHPRTDEDDRLVVALMKREDVFTIVVPEIPCYCRKEGKAVIRLPPACKDYVHLYCYFCSATGEKSSESRYFCLMPKL